MLRSNSPLDAHLTATLSQDLPGLTYIECRCCKQSLPLSQYYKDNTRRSGNARHMTQCKSCNLDKGKSKRNAALKLFGGKNAAKAIKENRPPEGTPCKCCKAPMHYKRDHRMVCFDHDPKNDTFRGWICQKCNVAIGQLGDDIEGVKIALLYLINSTQPHEPQATN